MRQQHEQPHRVDLAAERLELLGQQPRPGRHHQPAAGGVVVEVRVRRQLALADHRPRLLDVDPLVGAEQGVLEQVVRVRHHAADQ